jgi:hypothetical protein
MARFLDCLARDTMDVAMARLSATLPPGSVFGAAFAKSGRRRRVCGRVRHFERPMPRMFDPLWRRGTNFIEPAWRPSTNRLFVWPVAAIRE